MTIIILVLLVLIGCFGLVVFVGAPYLPTLGPQVTNALDLADLRPGQTLLELGCGDGKVLVAAAERGWNVRGYELNPLLAAVCWLRTRRYGKRVRVVCGNFWRHDWPASDAIFVFLLDKYMTKLDKKIVQSQPQGTKLISFAFQMPSKTPIAQRGGVYVYEYTAQGPNGETCTVAPTRIT